MDETTTEWIGLLFVFIGIFGFAFLHLNTLGHVISGLNIDTPFQEKIEFPQIEPLIMKANEQKIITFDIQNNGKETLTDCIFSVKNEKNEISDWIKAPQKTDIPPSQKKSFEFYITTPHDAQPKTYYKKIKLICDKKNHIQKSIILGRSPATGQAIFNIAKGKGLGYFTFLAFIGIGIFFIFKNHRKALQENEEEMQDEDY